MEIKEIYELMERFQKSNISEMSLEIDSVNLQLKKSNAETVPAVLTAPSVSAQTHNVHAKHAEDTSCVCIKAPLVGTFYRAPSPESKPFVLVGQKIKKGDVVGIIEAMKLMNEVIAPSDGMVTDILASDGCLVQFDEVLIKMKES